MCTSYVNRDVTEWRKAELRIEIKLESFRCISLCQLQSTQVILHMLPHMKFGTTLTITMETSPTASARLDGSAILRWEIIASAANETN